MASNVNWKQRYYELRSKYLNAIDVAFRLGVQEGQKNQKMQDMEMQLTQMQEAQAMGGGEEGMEPGMEGQELPPEEGMDPGMEQPEMGAEGEELDTSIEELEQYVKSEGKGKGVDFSNLMKSFHKNKEAGKYDSKDKRVEKVNNILEKWEKDE